LGCNFGFVQIQKWEKRCRTKREFLSDHWQLRSVAGLLLFSSGLLVPWFHIFVYNYPVVFTYRSRSESSTASTPLRSLFVLRSALARAKARAQTNRVHIHLKQLVRSRAFGQTTHDDTLPKDFAVDEGEWGSDKSRFARRQQLYNTSSVAWRSEVDPLR